MVSESQHDRHHRIPLSESLLLLLCSIHTMHVEANAIVSGVHHRFSAGGFLFLEDCESASENGALLRFSVVDFLFEGGYANDDHRRFLVADFPLARGFESGKGVHDHFLAAGFLLMGNDRQYFLP